MSYSLTSQVVVSLNECKGFERMQGYASSTQNKSIEIVHSSNSSVAKDETPSNPPTSHRSKMLPTFGEAEAYFKIVIFPTQQECAKGANDNFHYQLRDHVNHVKSLNLTSMQIGS